MPLKRLYEHIINWVKEGFTGIVTIEFHEGGIRAVKAEHIVK